MDTEKVVQKDANTKKGGKSAVIVLLIVVIIALIGLVIYLLMPKEVDDPSVSKGTVVTEDNVDEIIDEVPKATEDPGHYTVTMNNDWVFEYGDSISSNAYVENATSNEASVRFEIFMADDESDVIYRSPVLPVGSKLEDIALDKKLDAGNYDTVIKYILVDDNGNDMSYVRVTLNIIVQN